MNMDPNQPGDAFERIDADAVCEKCGSVNPPETLLCRTCGNNLRDQRQHRLAEAGVAPIPDEPFVQVRRVLSVALGVAGLVLILWTAFHVDEIEQWMSEGMVAGESSGAGNPARFWSWQSRKPYENLLEELRKQEHDAVYTQPGVSEDVTGIYSIRVPGGPVPREIGRACVLQMQDLVQFVAVLTLDEGEAEIRGEGIVTGVREIEVESAGVKMGERYLDGYGYAEPGNNGELRCYALTAGREKHHEVQAFRLQ